MRLSLLGLLAGSLVAAFPLFSGCGVADLGAGSNCCACLLLHAPGGEVVDIEADPLPENCLASEGSYEDQNQVCANHVAEQLTGETSPVPVTSQPCLDTVCASECGGDSIELEVVDDSEA